MSPRTGERPRPSLQQSLGNRLVARLPAEGPGRPLPAPARQTMERAFGADFSDVRVHEGRAAEGLGAEAFTRGAALHFAPTRFDPGSRRGLELLGHELAHVVQQREGRARGGHDPHLEAQADAWGAMAARGERLPTRNLARAHPGPAAPLQPKITVGGQEKPYTELDTLTDQVLGKLFDLGKWSPPMAVNPTRTAVREAIVRFHLDATPDFADLTALTNAVSTRMDLREQVSDAWSAYNHPAHEAALDNDQQPARSDLHHAETPQEKTDAEALAGNHPERPAFMAAVQALGKSEADADDLWKLTIRAVAHQKKLNEAGARKTTSNVLYAELARAFSDLLVAQRAPALWAGGYDASIYAQSHGYTTLEATHAGRLFDGLKLFGDFKVLAPLWNNISREFVKSFNNKTVHIFLRTFDHTSVLVRQELDELVHLSQLGGTKWHVLAGGSLSTLRELDASGAPVNTAALNTDEAAEAATHLWAREGYREAVLRLPHAGFWVGKEVMPEEFAALVKEDAEDQLEQLDILEPNLGHILDAQLRRAWGTLLRPQDVGKLIEIALTDLDLRLRNDPAVLLGLVKPATIPALVQRYIQRAVNLGSQ